MKKTEIRIVCDLCGDAELAAEIRCQKHNLDLCTRHMRAHFDPKKCRLLPVERDQTPFEKSVELLAAAKTETSASLAKLKAPKRRR